MNPAGHFSLDGVTVAFESGDTVMQAATRAGIHVPHLCWRPELGASGSCRLCTVKVDGRQTAAKSRPRLYHPWTSGEWRSWA